MLWITFCTAKKIKATYARTSILNWCSLLLGAAMLMVIPNGYAATPADENYDDNGLGDFATSNSFTVDGVKYTLIGAGTYRSTIENSTANSPLSNNVADHFLLIDKEGFGNISSVKIEAADGSAFHLSGFSFDGIADVNITVTPSSGSALSYSSNGFFITKLDVDTSSSGNTDFQNITSVTFAGGNISISFDDLNFEPAVLPTPTITNASYNVSTSELVVTGTNFTATVGAINDVVANKFTLTGEGGTTYTLTDTADVEISSPTSFTLTLGATDRAGVNMITNKNGSSSTGGTSYNLAGAAGFIADEPAIADVTGNAITVSNVPLPIISNATYDASTGVLTAAGSGFTRRADVTNDIVANKFTLYGEGGSSYTLTDTANVEVTSGISFTLTLSATDKAGANLIMNKDGASSTDISTYNLAAAEDWNAGADTAVNIADVTGNGITASNVAVPTVTSATYNASTGALEVTGTGLLKLNGATNDVVANKFTFTGQGGTTYSLADTANVEITSGTTFTLTLSATDKSAVNLLLNKNGSSSVGGTIYNLAAAEDWVAGADASVAVADLTGNGITASNVVSAPDAPTIGTAVAGDGQASVTFTAPGSNGGSAITTYTATASPGGATGSCAGPAACTIVVTGLTNGTTYTFTVTATNAVGTSVASGATSAVTPKGNQTITFANPGAQNFGTTPTLSASSNSALSVAFSSSTTGVCTITSGGALTFVTAGICTIDADQSGNGSYAAATTVSRSFTVNAVVPGAPMAASAAASDTQASIGFNAPAFTGGAAITGYTVTSNPDGLTGTGAGSPIMVTGLTNGVNYTFTVKATNSAGTGIASTASNAIVPKAAQIITFANPGAQNFGTSPTLSATSTSSLTVAFSSSTPSVCTITSGGTLSFVTAGTCTINANQAGNSAYLPAAQVIQSFTANAVVAGAPTIVTATAGDTQANVSFSAPASNGGVAITGYTVTSSPGGLTASGVSSPLTVTGLTNGLAYSFSVTATNSAGTGSASSASNSVTPQAAQTITFSNPGAQSFGTTPTLTASASSSLTPSFTSSTTGVCTITSGGTLSFVTTGTCTVNANQAGNTAYLPAAQVSQSFSVNAVVADAPSIGTATRGDAQASVSFTAPASTGGAAITAYTVTSSPGGLTASGTGSPLTVLGLTNGTAYTFSVTAQSAAGTSAASNASNSVTPIGSQTITFPNPGAQSFGTTPTLTASASSSLTPSFTSSTTGVCTITSGGALSFVTTGTCTINADQAGNASYLAAAQVSQSFSVNAVVADAPSIGTATRGDAQASVSFTAPASTGGAAITAYTVTSSPGGLTASGTGSPLTVLGLTNGTAYTFSVTAQSAAGTSAASNASNSVTPIGSQTITFPNPGAQSFGTTPTLTASVSSGLSLNFTSSTTGVCSISSTGVLTFITTGSCTINANQAGNASYTAAAQVSQTFAVNAVVAGVPSIGTATAGDTQATVSFTPPSNNGGAAITGYTVTSSPGGLTASGTGSPLTVLGLTNGTAYTFSVTAQSAAGTSAASNVSNSVTPIGSQTITFPNPGAQSFGTTPTLTASVSSGLSLSFTSSTTGVCSISSTGVLTFITTGSCTINANQAGNASYTAAVQVSQTFAVNAVVAGVPSIGTATAGDTQATVSFTPPSNNGGAAITGYTVTSSPGGLTASGTGSPLTVLGLTNGTAYTFSVTAQSAAGTSAASSASNSVTPNGAPVINSSPILNVDQGASYSYTLTAVDTVGDTLTYSALNIPIWLSFDTATGNLTGVPNRDNIGSHAIELKVTDAAGLFATQAFTLDVNATNSAPVASDTSVTLDEDGSLSISFSATDPENDVLSFEVLTQPISGKLDKHGSVWLYTPEADFNGNDSISFIAKDAELSSQPGVVSIKVNPINDEPNAVDDSYSQSVSTDSSYILAVLDNDTDVDGDTLTIDGAAADVGDVQIVASQLKYQAPTDFVGPVTLRYTISDGQKGRSNAKVQLIIIGESSADAPVITVPADITANATGLFTKLKLGVATAVDKAGNKLAVSLVNTQQLFAPGEHLAYWQATDSQGLSSIKSQKVTVNPLISISRNQVVAEGSEVQLSVFLNGPSPQYPVRIPYTVSGSSDANDHDLVDGVFIIESGLSASFSTNIFDDAITEVDEDLIINLDPSINISNQSETRLIITEANIAPQASIQVTQSNELRSQVSKVDGKVYLKTLTRDANALDNLSEVWSTGSLVLESDEQGSYFDPSGLDEGNYPISVVVTDDGIPELSTTVQLTLLVKSALPILSGDDSDGDLIPDDQEGFTDTDSDGIADYLDAINECNVLQEKSLEQSNFLAESQSGVCLRLGNTAQLNGSDGIEIQEDDLIEDLQADNLGGLFDFELTDIPRLGDSVTVVIPQTLPVPMNAVYRKFVRGSWQEFVSNANNSVMSIAGNPGYCPPPGAAEWQPGLTEGHWCVQLTIEDGGPNDDDGIANGNIVDPGGVAVMLNGNALPLAVADAITVLANQGIEIDVLANDSDADGDTLTVKQVSSQFGTAEVLDNQQISYLPAEDFIGIDVLVYSISDGNGGTGSNKLTVTVVANRAPIAVDDMANTDDKTSLILDVLSNDSDPDNQVLSLIAVSAQQGGVMIENNKVRYIPKAGFEGVDTVIYTISDGQGGEATANVIVTIEAYKPQVVDNESSGGSMHWLWSGLLLLVIMLRIKPEGSFKYYKVLSLSLMALLASSSHVQAQGSSSVSPWYLDGIIGFSESVNTQAELQREIPTGQIEAFDKSDTSFGLTIGYQVTPLLAFELGYIDFGEGSAQISGESLHTGQYHELLKAVSPILPTGFSVGVDLSLVEHDGWRFSVPVGLLVWESEVKSYSQGQTLTTQFDGTDWYTGMHLDYQFTRNWSAGLGMDYIALAPNDILSYQFNLRYQF